jgi:hypothetical protein
MRIIFFALSLSVLAALVSCGESAPTVDPDKALADSLSREVIDGHNVAMAKMKPLTKGQEEVRRVLDSLNTLPAKLRSAAAPQQAKLDSLLSNLKNAEFDMNKWMNEFSYDSFTDNLKKRVKYMSNEKIKVNKLKEKIFNSLQSADSILRKRF